MPAVSRPNALGWLIDRWIRTTGRTVKIAEVPWLYGPTGKTDRIGPDFYEQYASEKGLALSVNAAGCGLLEDFAALESTHFAPEKSDRAVHDFYEKTVDYTLDAWAQWTGPLFPFAQALISLVSRSMEQFNLPLSPLEVSHGISSDIIRLTDAESGEVIYTGWLRTTVSSGRIIFAGFYTLCTPPGYPGACVKVVFPVPEGLVTVILKPQNQEDGSFKLISAGKRFGEPGYYRMHRQDAETLRVRYLPLKESIHVYQDGEGVLRTDHTFRFLGSQFLALHYKILPKTPLR